MPKVNSSLVFIFITVLLDCIGVRIVSPVLASLIAEVSGVNVIEGVKSGGWLMASYALMQFLFSPFIGALSDRYGRRPVLLLALLGLGLDYVLLYYANSLMWLFAGRIIAGICGASISTAFAYTADISSDGNRTHNFGIIGSAIALGFIIGPFIGGVFSQWGLRVPFVVAAILSFLNLLYGLYVLPESLPVEKRRAVSVVNLNPLLALKGFKDGRGKGALLVSLFFMFMANQVMPSVWPFYTKLLYNWTDLQIGYSITFVGLLMAIVKGGLLKFVQKPFKQETLVICGVVLTITGNLLFSLVLAEKWLYFTIILYCLGGISSPVLQSIISGEGKEEEQGEIQGTITSLMGLAGILSPLIMTNFFHYYTRFNASPYFPGVSFLAAAVLGILSLFFLFFRVRKSS